jgi:hypothetical protein
LALQQMKGMLNGDAARLRLVPGLSPRLGPALAREFDAALSGLAALSPVPVEMHVVVPDIYLLIRRYGNGF